MRVFRASIFSGFDSNTLTSRRFELPSEGSSCADAPDAVAVGTPVDASLALAPMNRVAPRAEAGLPAKAAVYLLWVKLKNGKWRCFYVGQASDLDNRLLNHLSDDEENECIQNKVSNYICGF